MAEAWYRHFSKKNNADSAALINPQERMHISVVRAIKEFGLDVSKLYSKRLTDNLIGNADIIILMSKDLKKSLSLYEHRLKPTAKIEYWDIPDIVARETDEHLYPKFIAACEIIRDKVKKLIAKYE